jgi:hypothetical protein
MSDDTFHHVIRWNVRLPTQLYAHKCNEGEATLPNPHTVLTCLAH